MNKKIVIFATILCLSTATAQEAEFSAEYEVWKPSMDTSIKSNGTDIHLKNTLGMEDKSLNGLSLRWQSEKSDFKATYYDTTYHGDKNVTQPVVFQNKTYDVGNRVISDLKMKMLDLNYKKQISQSENSKVSFVSDLKVMRLDTSLQDLNNPSINDSKKYTVPVPSFGIAYETTARDSMNFHIEATALPLFKYGHVYNVDAGITLKPDSAWDIALGYRIQEIKVQDKGNYVNFRLPGAYFTFAYHF